MSASNDSAEVGDLVHDEAGLTEAVVTDIRRGTYILRPRYGGGLASEWAVECVHVLARRVGSPMSASLTSPPTRRRLCIPGALLRIGRLRASV
ncbi:MAG: hypothetical protein ACRDP3_05720 [Streptomyces sp.]|uniref:hypothetical protein n=1 Tax=Streptomyces sp. TaxID=1931 RepID=UPI003D6BFDF1